MKDHYSHAATILPVSNAEASSTYYQEKLGFEETFRWGEPVDYVVLKAGDVSLHLSKRSEDHPPSKQHVAVMIFVYRIDELYASFLREGVNIKNPIGDRTYGMRDFDILDPDGHVISFGQGLH